VVVSFSSLPLVALVFSGTIRALDPDRLHDRRVRRLREEVERAVEREIFERIALSLMEERCRQAGARLRLVSAGPAPEGTLAVRATRDGRVRDVDLARLGSLCPTGRVAELSEGAGASPAGPELRVRLGEEVRRGQVVLVLPSPAGMVRSLTSSVEKRIEKKARRVIKLERAVGTDALARASERLHEEALAVIRSGSPSRYEDVLEAYEEALFAFPDAWQRYGQRFDSDTAGGLHPLGLGQTDAFLTNLAIELDEAARNGVRDVAFRAAYAPARLARRAYPPDATALLEKALRLLNVVYHAAAARSSAGDNEVAKAVKVKVWIHLQEFADYPLAAALESWETTAEEDLCKAEAFLHQIFASYGALMKAMLESGDLESLKETDLSWSGIFGHWMPEYDQPFKGTADRLAGERGEEDDEVRKLRRREELKQRMIGAKEKLFGLRIAHRYGLCFWALRRVLRAAGGEPQEDPSRWARIFEHFRRSYFTDLDRIVEGANLAFAAETGGARRDAVPWSDWILFDLPPGPGGTRGGAVGADGEILRVFVALLLMSPDLERRAPSVGPIRWLPPRLESAKKALDEVSRDPVLLERASPTWETSNKGHSSSGSCWIGPHGRRKQRRSK
jgi:hypothetical protein